MVHRFLQTTLAWLIASVLAFNAIVAPVAHGPSCHRLESISDCGDTTDSNHRCCQHLSSPTTPSNRTAQVGFSDGKFHGHADHDCLACKYLAEIHGVLQACDTCVHKTFTAADPIPRDGVWKFLPHDSYLARGPPPHHVWMRLFGV